MSRAAPLPYEYLERLARSKPKSEVVHDTQNTLETILKSPNKSNIVYKKGDILETEYEFIINPVIYPEIMGSGAALALKTQYPLMFADFMKKSRKDLIKDGEPYIFYTDTKSIIIFPLGSKAKKEENTEKCLVVLKQHLTEWGIKSLAISAKEINLKLVLKHLINAAIDIEIFNKPDDKKHKLSGLSKIAIKRLKEAKHE
jgi:hypothetical protein